MINIKIDEGETRCEINGTGPTIVSEMTLAVKVVYDGMKESNGEKYADMFRQLFVKAIDEGLPFMSDDDLDEALKESQNARAKAKKALNEFLDKLKDIMDGDE